MARLLEHERRTERITALGVALAFALSCALEGCSAEQEPHATHGGASDASPSMKKSDDGAAGASGHDAGAPSIPPSDAEVARADARGSAVEGGTEPMPTDDGSLASDREPPANVAEDAALFGDAGPPPLVCTGSGARFATSVVAHAFGPGQDYGQNDFPAAVLGPPKGGGACAGSTDVVSLGNGGWVVLEFAGDAIVDGPGPDFIVFENPFEVDCDPSMIFAELGTVAVSEDGEHWTSFPCTATMPPYGECSGWHVVYANAETNSIDPTDPSVAGGDPYDLADIGVKEARYVRVTDRPDLVGENGVYDLDAVSIVHPLCP